MWCSVNVCETTWRWDGLQALREQMEAACVSSGEMRLRVCELALEKAEDGVATSIERGGCVMSTAVAEV